MKEEQQGWIGVLTEPIKISDIIEKESMSDLLANKEILDYETTNIPIEEHSHFTGIYGLTKEGCFQIEEVEDFIWIPLQGKSVKIEDLEFFECDDNLSCLVATLKKEDFIMDFRDRVLSYNHYEQEFSDYKPHITVCWFRRYLGDEEKKTIKNIFSSLIGQSLEIRGIEIDNPYYSECFDKEKRIKFLDKTTTIKF